MPYIPHVQVIMVNQPLKFLNSDGLLHNVHALPKVNTAFNMADAPEPHGGRAEFTKEEGAFPIKCDVHPWMSAYVGSSRTPSSR